MQEKLSLKLVAAAKAVDLGHIAKGVEGIKATLGAYGLLPLLYLPIWQQTAVLQLHRLVKAFTLDPAKLGFTEYATNLNAVQTILANTQAAGATLKMLMQLLKS